MRHNCSTACVLLVNLSVRHANLELQRHSQCTIKAQTRPVQVYFKPEEVTYERLLDEFFAKVDPTTMNRQGNDMGTQYRSVSFLTVAASLGPQRCSSCAKRFGFCHVCPCVLLASIRFAASSRQAGL